MQRLWQKKRIPELPQIALKNTRIIMRPPELEDWREWAAVRKANESHLKPFEPRWPDDCLTEAFFLRRLARQQRDWANDHGQSFLIFHKDNGRLIGGMNINNISRGAAQFAALGYWIDKAHEGQGYMREAMQTTLEYCFEHLNLRRVNASCIPQNTRSKNLLLKAGFEEEGFAPEYLQIAGRWQDHILFGYPLSRWKKDGKD